MAEMSLHFSQTKLDTHVIAHEGSMTTVPTAYASQQQF